MKYSVTGANGFLGRGVVKQLLDDGHEVVAVDIKTDLVDSRAISIDCDIFSEDNPYNRFGKPDVLLHMAWRDGFVHNATSHILDLPKHFIFLDKMFASSGSQVAVMGTMHEVGYWEGVINEDTPCAPMSYYGIAKNALRRMVEILADKYNKPYQWLRGFYIVDNISYGASIFSKIKKAAEEGKKVFPFTTGRKKFDFLDYNDFCAKVAASVEQALITGIINICSGHPESLSSRVERFIAENSLDIKLEYGKFPDKPYESDAIWGNDEKIKEIMRSRG